MKQTRFFKKAIVGGAIVFTSFSFADSYFEISKNLDVFSALYKEVNVYYVDPIEPSKLMRSCLDGMLKTLDPYTVYYSESQVEKGRIEQSGKFGGIGIDIAIMNDYPTIVEVIKDLPADKQGLKVGDRILEIDHASTQKRSKEDVDKFLRGQAGSNLFLKIERIKSANTTQTSEYNLARVETQETNVPFYGIIGNNIGCIRLKIFDLNAGKDVKTAFEKLKTQSPDMKGLILDLRGNPGGLLNEAVNIVNLFVDKNQLVVNTKGKAEEWNSTFRTLNEPIDLKIPIVVIADNMSASASEIVSGCMQDLDRGVILGQRTYGKGLVQVTKNLSYNTVLKVTTAKYYIPSGRCIQAINYAERNEDGSVKHIPDSLKVAFKTKIGRKVFDGGGIDPDVAMPKQEYSKIAQALLSKNLVFDFATQYVLKHQNIAETSTFKLTETEYGDFINFLKNKEYSYNTESEKLLEKLKESSTEEKYFDAVKPQYEEVKKKLQHDKEVDLQKQKIEITQIIESEIAGRYFYIHGKLEKSLLNDSEINKAIEIITSTSQYSELLSATKK